MSFTFCNVIIALQFFACPYNAIIQYIKLIDQEMVTSQYSFNGLKTFEQFAAGFRVGKNIQLISHWIK